MRAIFSFILIWLVPFSVNAEDDKGFVTFVNLVGAGTGNVFMEVNGKSLWEKGYKLGQKTGAIPFSDGSQKLVVSREGCLTAERNIDVSKGISQTVMAFAEEEFDEEGNSLGWQIKIAGLKQHSPEKGFVVTLVSFCKEDKIDLTINENLSDKEIIQSVERMQSKRLMLSEQGGMRASFSYLGERLGSIKVDKQGNYVVVFYDSEDGGKKMKHFYDPKFMLFGS